MSFLDKMKEQYGELPSEQYNKAVSILKEKIENAYKNGKSCCVYMDTPEILDRLKKDTEFEGIKFKESSVTPKKSGFVSTLVCWD